MYPHLIVTTRIVRSSEEFSSICMVNIDEIIPLIVTRGVIRDSYFRVISVNGTVKGPERGCGWLKSTSF